MAALEALLAMMGLGQQAEAGRSPSELAAALKNRNKGSKAAPAKRAAVTTSAQPTAPAKSADELAAEKAGEAAVARLGSAPDTSETSMEKYMRLAKKYPDLFFNAKQASANIVGPDENIDAIMGANIGQEFLKTRAEDMPSYKEQLALTKELRDKYNAMKGTTAGTDDLSYYAQAVDNALGTKLAKGYKDPSGELRKQLQEAIKNQMAPEKAGIDNVLELYKKQFLPPTVFGAGYKKEPVKAGGAGKETSWQERLKAAEAYDKAQGANELLEKSRNLLTGLTDSEKAILATPGFFTRSLEEMGAVSPNVARIKQFITEVQSTYGYDVSGKVINKEEMERLKQILGMGATQTAAQLQEGVNNILGIMHRKATNVWERGFSNKTRKEVAGDNLKAAPSKDKGAPANAGRAEFLKSIGK